MKYKLRQIKLTAFHEIVANTADVERIVKAAGEKIVGLGCRYNRSLEKMELG